MLALIVFAVSAYQLFGIIKGYMDGRNEYEEIRDLAIESSGGDDEPEGFRVNFDELLAVNPDTIGWIRFYTGACDHQLSDRSGRGIMKNICTRHFRRMRILWERFCLNAGNSPDFTDRNSIVYGHRMKDGSMFRHLQDYEDQSFWESNPYFYIYTPDGREITYHIYSVGQVEDTSDTYLTSFASDEDYQAFLDMTKEISLYDTGVEVTTEDTIVTLSTCTSASDEHRFVVRGVKESEVNLNQ